MMRTQGKAGLFKGYLPALAVYALMVGPEIYDSAQDTWEAT